MNQEGIDFDRDHAVGAIEQRLGQRALARSDLDGYRRGVLFCESPESSEVGLVTFLFSERADELAESEMNGRQILLCWRLGEPEIQFWHDVDAGYAGRQPLSPSLVG